MEASILRILVIIIGIALVAVVLFQQPKEGGLGAFSGGGGGNGASSTVFGAQGSGSFLFKLTSGLILAFVVAIVLLVKTTNNTATSEILSTSASAISAETIPGQSANSQAQDTIPGTETNTQ